MGLLDGKKGLVLNIANDRSIAAHIAHNAVKQGATCGFGFLPMDNPEKSERRVRKAMEEHGFTDSWLHPCDVGSDQQIERFFAAAKDRFGTIDFLVHSLAFADRNYLVKGKFHETPRNVFAQALDISAYSLIAITRAAMPLMTTRISPSRHCIRQVAIVSIPRWSMHWPGWNQTFIPTQCRRPVRTA